MKNYEILSLLEVEIKDLEKQQMNAMEQGHTDIAKMLEHRIFEVKKLQIVFGERMWGDLNA